MTDQKKLPPATRPYLIVGKGESATKAAPRIVEAQNPAQAIRHVAMDTLSCRPLNATETIMLMSPPYGIKPERARRDQDTLPLPGVPE